MTKVKKKKLPPPIRKNRRTEIVNSHTDFDLFVIFIGTAVVIVIRYYRSAPVTMVMTGWGRGIISGTVRVWAVGRIKLRRTDLEIEVSNLKKAIGASTRPCLVVSKGNDGSLYWICYLYVRRLLPPAAVCCLSAATRSSASGWAC